jgi:putative endonuclease
MRGLDMRDYNFYVYMMTNKDNNVLYTGVTSNLQQRLYQHKHKLIKGFTSKYNVDKLVYYEHGTDVNGAISREKQIKSWNRKRKNNLVETMNPEWKDLGIELNLI